MKFTQTDYPLSKEQVEQCFQEENKVEFIVDIPLDDIIACYSIGDINEQCDEMIFGSYEDFSACIVDIGYEVEGATDKNTVAIRVIADVEEI